MRKTKIVCTIGPASESEETLIAMCRAGMNTARLNFSHGSHEEHHRRIELIKKVRALPAYRFLPSCFAHRSGRRSRVSRSASALRHLAISP